MLDITASFLQKSLNGQGDFSYIEAVLSCQGFLNWLCCAVGALEAHKPELLDQTKSENYNISF